MVILSKNKNLIIKPKNQQKLLVNMLYYLKSNLKLLLIIKIKSFKSIKTSGDNKDYQKFVLNKNIHLIILIKDQVRHHS